ncbi:MAG: GcrA family cell cycle regulator [Caulobacter sp.]
MLTRAQRQLLDFISAYIAKHRIAPTLVEMQGHMGLSSKSGAHRLLVALEDAGRIVRLPHRRRAIEVVDRSQGNTASLKIAKAAAPEAIRQSIPDQRAEDLSRTDLVQLLDLKAHHCRWPIGNPGDDRFGFCGHAKQGERPYCSLHSATAFQPTPVRNSTKELIRSVRRFA